MCVCVCVCVSVCVCVCECVCVCVVCVLCVNNLTSGFRVDAYAYVLLTDNTSSPGGSLWTPPCGAAATGLGC